MNICVYCGSSNHVAPAYIALADALGTLIGRGGHMLVYGGASVGLMGTIARAVHRAGGQVFGAIPEALVSQELMYQHADEMIVTRDMRERKAVMEAKADAFVALPGGIGTLEEVFEIMTLRHLNLTTKPLILLDHEGFYAPLIALLEHMRAAKFVRDDHASLYHLVPTIEAAFALLHAPAANPPGR